MERTPDNVRPIRPVGGRSQGDADADADRYLRLFAADGDAGVYVDAYVDAYVEVCGSLDALARLDDEPLVPTEADREPLTGRAAEVYERVEHANTDFAEWEYIFGPAERLDAETLLVVRRLLRRAAGEIDALGGRTSDRRLAAAFTWIAMTGNLQLGRARGLRKASEVWRWFGVSNSASIGRSIAGQLGMIASERAATYPWHPIRLGSPDLLTADARRWLIRARGRVAQLAEDRVRRLEERKPMRNLGNGKVLLQGRPIEVHGAVKLDVDGRHLVLLVVGGAPDDPDEILSLSVPDARLLVERLGSALHGPALPGGREVTPGASA